MVIVARGKDERDNENRRPQKPTFIRFDTWGADNPEMPHGNVSPSIADMIKQAVYDAEFNDIVGIPNDIVARPDEDEK